MEAAEPTRAAGYLLCTRRERCCRKNDFLLTLAGITGLGGAVKQPPQQGVHAGARITAGAQQPLGVSAAQRGGLRAVHVQLLRGPPDGRAWPYLPRCHSTDAAAWCTAHCATEALAPSASDMASEALQLRLSHEAQS